MFGLLGGESSFSDSSDSEQCNDSITDSRGSEKSDDEKLTSCKTKLPLPDLEVPFTQQGQLSVFSNQYKEEEEAKKAVLERHVELSSAAPINSSSKEKKHQSSYNSRRKGKPVQVDHVTDEDHPKAKRKRHAGLSGTLQPPKKFMQSFHKQQAEEKPWLNKK